MKYFFFNQCIVEVVFEDNFVHFFVLNKIIFYFHGVAGDNDVTVDVLEFFLSVFLVFFGL